MKVSVLRVMVSSVKGLNKYLNNLCKPYHGL